VDRVPRFAALVRRLKAFEQRKYFNAVIVFVSTQFFQSDFVDKVDEKIAESPTISGAARLLFSFMSTNEVLEDHLVSSLTRSTIPSLDDSLATRRSVIAALAQDEGKDSEFRVTFETTH
jgi:telomere length regulation protein